MIHLDPDYWSHWKEWAFREAELRREGLKSVNSESSLKAEQAAARKRRNAVGLSAGHAAELVAVANREAKELAKGGS